MRFDDCADCAVRLLEFLPIFHFQVQEIGHFSNGGVLGVTILVRFLYLSAQVDPARCGDSPSPSGNPSRQLLQYVHFRLAISVNHGRSSNGRPAM